MFSGSYDKRDVCFLLKKIDMPAISILEKERRIQSGGHYSEMISLEKRPSEEYQDIFYRAVQRNGDKFAEHVAILAKKIIEESFLNKQIVIVSLARAGTPVGVLLKRIIEKKQDKPVFHYSVSIIRDRGIDENALSYITDNHDDLDLFFVDGWTGKGVIGSELKKSVEEFNKKNQTRMDSHLYVVADISGTAYYSATKEDYLIPSAVLNSTVSGLVSRTILNRDYIAENDFHGCVFYDELKGCDSSVWFVDEISKRIDMLYDGAMALEEGVVSQNNLVSELLSEMGFSNVNFIKPGVGEATRVLLRRVPKRLLLKDVGLPEVEHLLYLANKKGVPIEERKNLLYNAVSIIDEVD